MSLHKSGFRKAVIDWREDGGDVGVWVGELRTIMKLCRHELIAIVSRTERRRRRRQASIEYVEYKLQAS
ncbi:unnamed protein product [Angiostrongylus costaricensis]|uniref:OxoGdeHyase_C domain-containing protein n=1 Tax=Angiostrongylus costaricensis TaxID=334426 RepID=A0A0R3PYI9_ANGCS|nr:unnamed protein product [Angiostrongylus costaricensis]